MAIQSVLATICGKRTTLRYNPETDRYEYSGAAPQGSSFPLAGGYYPVRIEARTDRGETAAADDATPGLGESLRLVVRETAKPAAVFTAPAAGATLTTSRPAVTARLRDDNSGIDLNSLSFSFGGTQIAQGSPGLTLSPVAGGWDLTYVPPAKLDPGSFTTTLAVSDNDGNRSAVQSRSFTVALSGLPVRTDALCVKRLPGWKAGIAQHYQCNLLEPGYQAVLIRRCQCV